MKVIIFVFLLLTITNCKSSHQISNPEVDLVLHLSQSTYNLYKEKKYVPNKLFKFIKNKYNHKFALANPGQPYNKTDIYVEGIPNHQLIICGSEGSSHGFVLFKQGGSIRQRICLIYHSINKKDYEVTFITLRSQAQTFQELKNAITKGEYNLASRGITE